MQSKLEISLKTEASTNKIPVENDFAKSREFLLVFDARDCVPNGDREPGIGGPRVDSQSGKAIITDVCIKRTIRNYFLKINLSGVKIMARQGLEFSESDVIIDYLNQAIIFLSVADVGSTTVVKTVGQSFKPTSLKHVVAPPMGIIARE